MQSMRSLLPVLCFYSVVFARAEEFKNLTFDDADISLLEPAVVNNRKVSVGSVSKLLKGWSVEYGNSAVQSVYYGALTVSGAVTLYPNSSSGEAIWGRYSLSVWAMSNIPNQEPIPIEMSIFQKATIPLNVTGLDFYASDRPFQVLVNGLAVGSENGHADLRSVSGQDVLLEFRFGPGYIGFFDTYGFTTVPEPSEFAMLGLGLGVIGWQAWKRQRAHLPSPRNGGGRGSTHAPSSPADPV